MEFLTHKACLQSACFEGAKMFKTIALSAVSLVVCAVATAQEMKEQSAAGAPSGNVTSFLDAQRSEFAKWHIAPIFIPCLSG
jgi:hypothetical protein